MADRTDWPAWYTAELRDADRGLRGAWYRCERHGRTDAPLVLGEAFTYCPAPDCTSDLIRVHSWADDRATPEEAKARWSQGPVAPSVISDRGPDRRRRGAAPVNRDDEAEPDSGPGDEDEVVDDVGLEEPAGPAEEPPQQREQEDDVVARPEEQITVRVIVEEMLQRNGTVATTELRDAVKARRPDLGINAVSVALQSMKRRGLVRNVESGMWEWLGARIEKAPPHPPTPVASAEEQNAAAAARPLLEWRQPSIDELRGDQLQVAILLTVPMRDELQRLVDDGFAGATIQEAAARELAAALDARRRGREEG